LLLIQRPTFSHRLNDAFQVTPVVALIGPRQCGKTTIADLFSKTLKSSGTSIHGFDLEDERDIAKLQEPMLMLSSLEGLIIIDEIHHIPDLFKSLRVLVDQKKSQKFLILGSASGKLLQQSSETLAGRISYIEMTPFLINEVQESRELWHRGGFPLSYLAKNTRVSYSWRQMYIKTFLERDIPALGLSLSPSQVRRFWTMLAHYHGQLFNASAIGCSLGINYKTAQSYLDLLESTFMIRRLHPWVANLKKRQVKACKVYIRDTGLLHTLLGIHNTEELMGHPHLGASFEGFAMEQILHAYQADPEDCFFWRTYNGAELDLLLPIDGKKIGFEFKYSSKPTISKSMRVALEELNLDHLLIITPETDVFPLHEKITVCSLSHACQHPLTSSTSWT